MKNYLIALVAAFVATFGWNHDTYAAPSRLKGSGTLITKQLTLPAFQSIDASRAVKVELVADEGQPTCIEADDNVMEYVVVKVNSDGILKVGISDEVRTVSSVHIRVIIPTDGKLYALRANAAARIQSAVRLQGTNVKLYASSSASLSVSVEAEKCEIDLSSAARLSAEVVADRCRIEGGSSADITATLAVQGLNVYLSSAAEAELKGAAKQVKAEVSSAAELDARHLLVERYDIEASSAADAKICCMAHLDAHASSAADITYSGACDQTHIRHSSGGSVRRQ